jgi:hypothetical protein
MAGRASAFLATSASAEGYLNDDKLEVTLAKLEKHPRMNEGAIKDFFHDWPAGQNGPTPQLYVTHRVPEKAPVEGEAAVDSAPVEHGASIQLRLPYPNAKIKDPRLNGNPIAVSEVDGYATWTARSSTYIQVNLSPESMSKEDLFIVTCDYEPGAARGHWDTWRTME